MDSQAAARPRPPYGLAFAVPELEFVRDWAARNGLRMHVRLDQVLDGAEFEELVMLCAPGRGRQALTLWRTEHGVIAQAPSGQPKGFPGVQPAVAHFAGVFRDRAPLLGQLARRGAWCRRLFART